MFLTICFKDENNSFIEINLSEETWISWTFFAVLDSSSICGYFWTTSVEFELFVFSSFLTSKWLLDKIRAPNFTPKAHSKGKVWTNLINQSKFFFATDVGHIIPTRLKTPSASVSILSKLEGTSPCKGWLWYQMIRSELLTSPQKRTQRGMFEPNLKNHSRCFYAIDVRRITSFNTVLQQSRNYGITLSKTFYKSLNQLD